MSTAVSRDGTRIGYTRAGQGPAVVLVDGALCYRNFGPMGELSALLAPRFTVYSYDRRGRGESGDTAPYAVEREIEDIAALIAEAGGSAYVYGTSSGAALALQAASMLPDIAKLAAFEAPYITDATRPPTIENYPEQLEAALAENQRGDAVILFMRYVGAPAEQAEQMRQTPMFPAFEAVAPTLLYDARCVENPTDGESLPPALVAQLGGLKTPALILGGGASPEWMLNTQRSIASAIPGAQFRVLEGQTHELAGSAVAPVLIEYFGG
ncbi:MAG TPA: alpha/beta fold hydrolase [Ktedonobacterales bacterium]|nr:alpha/beta fold hydrolase [Ktedonobacterales bacterium]